MIFSFLFPISGYVLGSIPFGLLLTKLRGVDIREKGSGNIGATNVTRIMGKGIGIMVLFADISKGLIPVAICRYILSGIEGQELIIALTGGGAILGHCYPVYLKFKGGKGVATATGVFLAICPISVIIALGFFLLLVFITGFISAGSIIAAIVIPASLHFLCPGKYMEIMAWGSAILIWWKHRENIRRLLKGEEKSWRPSKMNAQGL